MMHGQAWLVLTCGRLLSAATTAHEEAQILSALLEGKTGRTDNN